MASIQEQLKHIRSANDEWCDEHRKSVLTVPGFFPIQVHALTLALSHADSSASWLRFPAALPLTHGAIHPPPLLTPTLQRKRTNRRAVAVDLMRVLSLLLGRILSSPIAVCLPAHA